MGIVFGPFDLEEWNVMKMYKKQISYMSKNTAKFGSMLEKDKERYNNYYLKRSYE